MVERPMHKANAVKLIFVLHHGFWFVIGMTVSIATL